MVASVITQTDIALGILACGSANGLATSLGLPDDLDAQFEIAINAQPIHLPLLETTLNGFRLIR